MWSDDDRAKWRTVATERTLRHDRCGTFEWEWPDDRTSDPWEAGVHTCPGCYALDAKLDQLKESKGSLRGRSVRLYRAKGVTGGF